MKAGAPSAGPWVPSVLVELLLRTLWIDPWEEPAGNLIPICRIISERRQVPGSKNDMPMNFRMQPVCKLRL